MRDTQETEGQRLAAILDGIDDVVYIADPETFELLHVNRAFRRTWGDASLGKKCFRVLQGRDRPCPFCTNDKIFGEYLGRSYVWEFQNEVNRQWYRCSDKAIRWIDGRMVRFELASDITAIKETAYALQERVKELTCMQQVSSTIVRQGVGIEQALQESALALRAASQFPEHTAVRISLNGRQTHQVGDFDRCTERLTAAIRSGDDVAGSVAIGYTRRKPTAFEGPFLFEERKLINAVAELLGTAISRWRTEQQLREHQQCLEQEVQKRTAELDAANNRLKALTSKVINAQEEERKRVARELHDSIGQVLAALKMDAEWIADHAFDGPGIKKLATRLSTNLRETISTVRNVVHDLRPSVLDDVGVASAIESHAAELSKRFNVRCTTEVNGEPIAAPPPVATALFRVTQEALSNVVRHARASNVAIELEDTGSEVILSVRDDGQGIPEAAVDANESMGIIGMRERVALLGGTLTISSAKDHGTTVEIRIPYLI